MNQQKSLKTELLELIEGKQQKSFLVELLELFGGCLGYLLLMMLFLFGIPVMGALIVTSLLYAGQWIITGR